MQGNRGNLWETERVEFEMWSSFIDDGGGLEKKWDLERKAEEEKIESAAASIAAIVLFSGEVDKTQAKG